MFPLSKHLGGKSTHSVVDMLSNHVLCLGWVAVGVVGGGEIEREREDAILELVRAPALSVM